MGKRDWVTEGAIRLDEMRVRYATLQQLVLNLLRAPAGRGDNQAAQLASQSKAVSSSRLRYSA